MFKGVNPGAVALAEHARSINRFVLKYPSVFAGVLKMMFLLSWSSQPNSMVALVMGAPLTSITRPFMPVMQSPKDCEQFLKFN